MNRDQIILSGLLALDEFGFIAYKESDPQRGTMGTFALWSAALKNLSDQEVQAGFEWLLESWTNEYNRKPTPGDIKAFISKQTSLNYGEMWAEIMSKGHLVKSGRLNRITGQVERHQWSHQLIGKAIQQMGGLDVFLNLKTEQEATFRAQFRDIVKSINDKDANKAIVQPLIELQLAQAQSNQAGVAQIAEARERKQAKQDPMQDPAPIIEGIKAQFAKKQVMAQQASRESKKAQLEAYMAQNGIEIEPLLPADFWQDGQQELDKIDSKIESMTSILKGLKVV